MWIKGHGHFVLCCDQALSSWQTWSQSVNRNNRNATVEHNRQEKERSVTEESAETDRQRQRKMKSWWEAEEKAETSVWGLKSMFWPRSLYAALRTNPWRETLHQKMTWLVPRSWPNPAKRSLKLLHLLQKWTTNTVTEWGELVWVGLHNGDRM